MAHQQTNSVLVYVRMHAVTERGVVGLQADCSIFWLQRLQRITYIESLAWCLSMTRLIVFRPTRDHSGPLA